MKDHSELENPICEPATFTSILDEICHNNLQVRPLVNVERDAEKISLLAELVCEKAKALKQAFYGD